jgi:hypothetical protein
MRIQYQTEDEHDAHIEVLLNGKTVFMTITDDKIRIHGIDQYITKQPASNVVEVSVKPPVRYFKDLQVGDKFRVPFLSMKGYVQTKVQEYTYGIYQKVNAHSMCEGRLSRDYIEDDQEVTTEN